MNIQSLLCYKSLVLGTTLAMLTMSAHADSLWRGEVSQNFVSDKKAHAVGDILTILVSESSTATKANSTKTAKDSEVASALTAFLYNPASSGLLTKKGTLPALSYKDTSTFAGGGSINNNETITAEFAVQVTEVLPNRNLVIEGKRHTSFGGETQDIVLRGVVRPGDITPNNTVYSYYIANATVSFLNKGTVSRTQNKGWLTRIWEMLDPF